MKGISEILLVVSVAANVYMGLNFSHISIKLAEKEQAVQVINNRYYSFFSVVKNHFQAIKGESQRSGFFHNLFGPGKVPELDLSEWEPEKFVSE